MSKQKSILLLFFVLVVIFSLVTISSAQKVVLKHSELTEIQRTAADFTKPGGIVLGNAMPRAFHYGGRQAARTSDGIIHVSWEDATYTFPYYAHSTDALGLEWTTPVNIPETIGFENWSRSLMAKLSVDPTTDDIYLMPAIQVPGGVWRTQFARSTDGGATWSPFLDLGSKINVPTSELSWGTFTIGTDRIMHVTYAKQNQDMYYTKTNLTAADGKADLNDLVFTKSDGITVGAEPISFVPSGVVFQGTIILDRNNDPHIIFSGDGGSDTFGDKTPYHIYYKSAAQAWGPIPPTRLQAELEQCWGMPEMVFDKNNRGYYFMDTNGAGVDFGTWEPPVDVTSNQDFGTLNNGLGFEGSVPLNSASFPAVVVAAADLGYLPNADVDDVNDVVYVVFSTGGYQNATGAGGDILALKVENASTFGTTSPADMPWTIHRWLTKDGSSPLGDVGPDVIYNPASTHLDVFWSGAGAATNEANYLDGTAQIPAIDAKPQTLSFGLTPMNPINKGETLTIKGRVKNNGTSPLGPVPVRLTVTDSNGVELYSKDLTTPPMLADQVSNALTFGTWTVPADKQRYSVTLSTNYAGDEAAYNNTVSSGFYAYPAMDEVAYMQTFQDYINFDADSSHIGYAFPTWSAKLSYNQDINVGGWTVVDSSNAEQFDYLNTFLLSDNDVNNDIGAYLRHMNGIRNDTTFGDMPTGTPPQPQNELLYSPVIDLSGREADKTQTLLQLTESISGTDGDNNFPIYCLIQASSDGGATWNNIVAREKTVGGAAEALTLSTAYYTYNITEQVGAGASQVQLRFWWKNLNNDASFGTWFIDNVTVVVDYPVAVESQGVSVAKTYSLSQNYPNPFNPTTEISYSVAETGHVELVVYNVVGQQVAKLVNGTVIAGSHKIMFDASALPTGVYFYKLNTANFQTVKKMALVK